MNGQHYIVPLFGQLWWSGFISSLIIIGLMLFIGKRMDAERQMALGKAIGLFLLFTALVIHIYE